MSDSKNKSDVQLNNMIRYIRSVLRKAGGYNSTLGYQIELVATDLLIFRRLRSELLALDSPVIRETTDRGNERVKPHPLVYEVREQSRAVSKGLDALLMNVKSKKGKMEASDSFTGFLEKMGE